MNAQVQAERFKLTVDHFHRMIETGVLGAEDHLELIDGELIKMVPPKPRHADCVDALADLLRGYPGSKLRVQNPVTLPDHSEPQPDIALVTPQRYPDRHPYPEDIRLLVEVADTSLAADKQIKLPLYARYRIPEVWIIDVAGQAVECFWEPSAGAYTKSSRVSQGSLVSSTLPEITVSLDALWPSGQG